jgi:hypothetical protein
MSEMLSLGARKRLCEEIGGHVLGRTINELDRAFFDRAVNRVPPNIDMFGSGVKLPV